MIRPPEYISSIKPYMPGKPVEELQRELGIKDAVKLASNENPIGPSKLAIEAFENLLGGIHRYPDGGAYYLREALSKRLEVDSSHLIFGSGSNELIDIAVRTFLSPGDEAVMAAPSFVIYSMSVRAHGATPIEVPLKGHRHDLRAMADAVTDKTRILFIANPNNPTGTINTQAEFDALMRELPGGVLVVLDEAYRQYVADPEYADGMAHYREGRDVLILRTFSKIYGLAGLRIGYGIAGTHIVAEMDKVRPPFNTASPAQAAAMAALNDHGHIDDSKAVNEEGKKYLYEALTTLGVDFVHTEANFIYLMLKQEASRVNEQLLAQGVIIRPVGPNEIRVTVGLPEENKRFIEALAEII